MSKLHDFAQAVGADIKEIKTALAGKAEKGEVTANGITQDQLNTAIQGVKTAILGEASQKNSTHSRKSLIKSVLLVAILTAVSSVK